LLTACLRAAGIPAAVGFADVRNHMNSPKLAELMQTDLFIYHGYVKLWLNGKPYKVTPAFNWELCERFGVKPLVFDGRSDALFHEFDTHSQRHMEYVNDRGVFEDVPIDEILAVFRKTYPRLEEFLRQKDSTVPGASYDAKFASPSNGSANSATTGTL
jgi:transglutaminase-like putative cysteine protease